MEGSKKNEASGRGEAEMGAGEGVRRTATRNLEVRRKGVMGGSTVFSACQKRRGTRGVGWDLYSSEP